MIARKRFGQHFLEPAWVVKVVDAIAPKPGDRFFEIGPGRGALTRSAHGASGACDGLRDRPRSRRGASPDALRQIWTIVEGDFLESQAAFEAPAGPIRVAGNLPYNVASPILFKLIELYDAGVPLTDATLMLQREVADRLLARPRTKEYGVLSVLVCLSADVERPLSLPPGAFRPDAEGKVVARAASLSPAGTEPARPGGICRVGPSGFQAAAENPRERRPTPLAGDACLFSARTRGRRIRSPASSGNAGNRRIRAAQRRPWPANRGRLSCVIVPPVKSFTRRMLYSAGTSSRPSFFRRAQQPDRAAIVAHLCSTCSARSAAAKGGVSKDQSRCLK